MDHHYFIKQIIIIFVCFCCLCTGISQSKAATTTSDDVYRIADLTNRGLDVILRKSKGAKQPVIPNWTEKNLNCFHVYQLQVACLDEIRRMESSFKMTPYPHIIVSPNKLDVKNMYKLSTIILSEVRRIAIHLNIWGLPKQKRSFSGEKPNDIFEETVAIYLKLRVLGEQKNIAKAEVSGEFERAICDLKQILNHIDPARRYQDVFPEIKEQNIKKSYNSSLDIRTELNKIRSLYKLPKVSLPTATTKPSTTDLLVQSQIILGDLNQLKTVLGMVNPTPVTMGKNTTTLAHQINVLHKLIRQIKPLSTLKGGQ